MTNRKIGTERPVSPNDSPITDKGYQPQGQRGYQPQSSKPLDPKNLTPPTGGSAIQSPNKNGESTGK